MVAEMAEFDTPYFRFMVPSSWNDETTYIMTGVEDPETGFRSNIVVQHRERNSDKTLVEAAEEEIAAVGEALAEPELIEQGPVDGCQVAAYGATWTCTTEEDFEVYQRQVYMLTEVRLYILTCTCLKTERKVMDEMFLRILRSFQPKT